MMKGSMSSADIRNTIRLFAADALGFLGEGNCVESFRQYQAKKGRDVMSREETVNVLKSASDYFEKGVRL